MFNSVILAIALISQCSGGSCGGGGCGQSYFGGGGYYAGGGCSSGGCGQSYYSGGGCSSGSCGQVYSGSYYGGVVRTSSQTTFQIVNTGHELTRSYAKATIDGKKFNIPVINGKLPIITCYGSRYVLDYSSEDYVYTTAYSSGVTYNVTTAAATQKTKSGAAALKNYDAVKPANKAKKGPSGLKTPDALEQKKAVSEELPSSVLGPSRPSDAEIDYLLK